MHWDHATFLKWRPKAAVQEKVKTGVVASCQAPNDFSLVGLNLHGKVHAEDSRIEGRRPRFRRPIKLCLQKLVRVGTTPSIRLLEIDFVYKLVS